MSWIRKTEKFYHLATEPERYAFHYGLKLGFVAGVLFSTVLIGLFTVVVILF